MPRRRKAKKRGSAARHPGGQRRKRKKEKAERRKRAEKNRGWGGTKKAKILSQKAIEELVEEYKTLDARRQDGMYWRLMRANYTQETKVALGRAFAPHRKYTDANA